MGTKPPFILIEESAKRRSTLFKYVSLRAADLVSLERLQKGFINHPDPTKSHFSSVTNNEQAKSKKDTFTPLTSADLERLNPNLFKFSDWLIRDRKLLTGAVVQEKVQGIKALTAAQELQVWDNVYCQVIDDSDLILRDQCIALLVAHHFINNHSTYAASDSDLQGLACAKVIIPKALLTQIKKTVSKKQAIPNLDVTSKQTTEDVLVQLAAYEKAIAELKEVQQEFNTALSKVDVQDATRQKKGKGGVKDHNDTINEPIEGAIASIGYAELLEHVDNPLTPTALKDKVSDETIEVVEYLKLHTKFKEPIKAVGAIETQLHKINSEAFKHVRLSKKVVATGGSIIQLNDEKSGEESVCNMPTLVSRQRVVVNTTNNTVYSTAPTTQWGLSGASSQEKITNDGYFQWQFHGGKARIRNTAIGLSYGNPDHKFESMNYGFKTYNTGFSFLQQSMASVFENGSPVGVSHAINSGDVLKVARDGQTMKYSINDVVIYESTAANPDQELIADLAFGSPRSMIRNLCFKNIVETIAEEPCSGVRNLGIADYLKLEQEICCYTAGEVSHIENILQGEYKERSTRRLRREENTTTFEREETTEKLRDTTTTDRYEMESETSAVIQEDSAFDIGVNISGRYGPVQVNTTTGYASATSSTNATSEAVSYGKEVTERALDRVITRVREERVNKVIEEFEENNVHGLDNSGNTDGHVVGVYRWVDKIYKNQVVNYGKRMMIEFMIPEPAKFHLWAMAQGEIGATLEAPEDPRAHGLNDHSYITESNYAYWAAAYGVKVDAPPPSYKFIGKSFDKNNDTAAAFSKGNNEIQVPEGYLAVAGTVESYGIRGDGWELGITLGETIRGNHVGNLNNNFFPLPGYAEGVVPFSYTTHNLFTITFNVTIQCVRSEATEETWKIDTYNKIISAYKEQKAAYDNALAEAKAQASIGIQIQGNNPRFNRTIEAEELKKGCLQWLKSPMGQDYYTEDNSCENHKQMPAINFEGDLGCYGQTTKFFEQAFEWDIMSYTFYPYFWGKKCNWKEIYRLDDSDPIFRGFLKAGMARVIVTVRPKFEDAVLYYLETGKVWQGNEAPVINDPLYISVLDEVTNQTSTPVGSPWETRVPTALNIVQQDATGVAGDGLPCFCDTGSAEGTGGSTMRGGGSKTTTATTNTGSTGGHKH